jgi:hypothetical protein
MDTNPTFPMLTAANEISADMIPYDREQGVIRLHPTSMEQCKDFPALIERAKQLRADIAGVFKIFVPEDLGTLCKMSTKDEVDVSTFKIRHQKQKLLRIDRMPGECCVRMELPQADPTDTVETLTTRFEKLLRKRSGLTDVRYCTDVAAKRPEDREHIGLPQVSPIWPTKENQLRRTKEEIPGLHWPYAYKSDKTFGAPFACHKEDCGLISANVLYYGQKIWTVTAPSDASSLETKVKASTRHEYTCAQAVRHCSTYIPRSKLRDWKISCLEFSHVANEVVVVFPNAYHQGFSTGSTLAEAINYAPMDWSIQGYSECLESCPGYPIPNAIMEFRGNNDDQEDEGAEAEPAASTAPIALASNQRHGSKETQTSKKRKLRSETRAELGPPEENCGETSNSKTDTTVPDFPRKRKKKASRRGLTADSLSDIAQTFEKVILSDDLDSNLGNAQSVSINLRQQSSWTMASIDPQQFLGGLSGYQREMKNSLSGEEVYRLRYRISLAHFADDYQMIQENSQQFLDWTADIALKLIPSDPRPTTDRPWKSLVKDRVILICFPQIYENAPTDLHADPEAVAKQAKARKSAARKIQDWLRFGKPYAQLIQEFGYGILRLVLEIRSDEEYVHGICIANTDFHFNLVKVLRTSLVANI